MTFARHYGKKTFFKKLAPQREKRTFKIAAFDTETKGLDGELLLAQAYHEDWQEPLIFKDAAGLLDHILLDVEPTLNRKTIWFAHNAEYDWRYFLAYFQELNDVYELRPIERMKGKFFEIGIYHRQILKENGQMTLVTKFRDSMALYPASLQKLTEKFAPEYEKKDIGLRWQDFDPSNPVHIDYAKNDVLGLVKALDRFDYLVWETFGTHIRATTASTAYNAMLRNIPDDEYHNRQKPEAEAFFRHCYYGGRVQLNGDAGTYYEQVTVFDINSSYPAAMRKGIPWGKPTFTSKYNREKPGFYKCVARVPEHIQLPLIPHKDEHGRLSFPHGEFTTFLSSLEIEYASKLGCSFQILEGYYFEDGLNHCFNELIDKCEELRARFKGEPLEMVVKLIQNSVYGKFGTKPEGREVVISFDAPPDGYEQVFDEETGKPVCFCYFKETERDSEYMLPHYAAWITANARITLDEGMRAAGAHNVLYADTDSLHMLPAGKERFGANPEHVGKRYGQYKEEKTFAEVRYHAPKSYTALDDKGELVVTYKGIPADKVRNPDKADPDYKKKKAARDAFCAKLHKGEIVEFEYHSSASMQSYMKKGALYQDRKRRSTNVEKIFSHILIDGKFSPRKVNEHVWQIPPQAPSPFAFIVKRSVTKISSGLVQALSP